LRGGAAIEERFQEVGHRVEDAPLAQRHLERADAGVAVIRRVGIGEYQYIIGADGGRLIAGNAVLPVRGRIAARNRLQPIRAQRIEGNHAARGTALLLDYTEAGDSGNHRHGREEPHLAPEGIRPDHQLTDGVRRVFFPLPTAGVSEDLDRGRGDGIGRHSDTAKDQGDLSEGVVAVGGDVPPRPLRFVELVLRVIVHRPQIDGRPVGFRRSPNGAGEAIEDGH
jgi:hypothetical protein